MGEYPPNVPSPLSVAARFYNLTKSVTSDSPSENSPLAECALPGPGTWWSMRSSKIVASIVHDGDETSVLPKQEPPFIF